MIIKEIFQAFILIFIAEMGDKTQILALAFATRYPVKKVLLGIFLGSLLNHGLAVALGSYISIFLPMETIQIIAGFAFVVFSLWTLKSDNDDGDENVEQKTKFGPIITVALAFFIGELGDKTQMTAITLATNAFFPFAVVIGTVSGMIATGGLGIYIGKKLGDRIPEFAIKIIAASIFMLFGVLKLYQSLPSEYITIQNTALFAGILSVMIIILLRIMVIKRKQGIQSAYMRKAKELHEYFKHMKKDMDRICLGLDTCKNCQGEHCYVGFAKEIVRNQLSNRDSMTKTFVPSDVTLDKIFDRGYVIDSLVDTIRILEKEPTEDELKAINDIRKQLELLLFKKSIGIMEDLETYIRDLENLDLNTAKQIFETLNPKNDNSKR
ncbi:MAG: TMEM165/GDT1 family protein [Eubacteriales bacterium]|nr:TMEM165/GDT1 family protein [Eubacteriales bacterium]